MKTLLTGAILALLISPASAGTLGCFKHALTFNTYAYAKECGDRDAREARSFERRERPDKPTKPEKPKKPKKEKKRHDHGKGDHSAGKGKGHEKGHHREH